MTEKHVATEKEEEINSGEIPVVVKNKADEDADKAETDKDSNENKNARDITIRLAEEENFEGDLKEIYELVKIKITQIVATGKFTAEHLRPLILNIVEIIQKYSENKYDHIDGAEKKAMALNILRHVIVYLHKNGQINQEQYELILMSLEFFGGALVDLAKSAYKLLIKVVDDVSKNGCAGCFGRNFKRR